MDYAFIGKAFLQVLLVGIAGYFAGKLLFWFVANIARKATAKTKSTLDDLLMDYVQSPLKAVMVILFIYVFSGYLADLNYLQSVMTRYSFAILVLIGSYVLSEAVGASLRWYYLEGSQKSKFKMDVTLIPFLRKITRIIILLGGLIAALSTIGFDVSGLLTLTSILVLILGLASQESLANIFAGLALQLDRPYIYGEYLRFPTGEVAMLQKIGLRSSKLADLSGNIMVISNSELAKQRVVNLSRPSQGFEAKFDLSLPVKADLGEFEKFIIKQIEGAKIQGIKQDSGKVLVQKVDNDKYNLQVSVYITHYQNFEAAKDFINRKALEFIRK
ncbi:MAG: mechanosensitive ion channel family protein [Candidatus Micrarchaeota archaeon]